MITQEPKFTPAPWKANQLNGDWFYVSSANKKAVANVNHVHTLPFIEFDEAKANNHLISAAPEMYEALEIIHDANEDCLKAGIRMHYPDYIHARVKSALKKARGEA